MSIFSTGIFDIAVGGFLGYPPMQRYDSNEIASTDDKKGSGLSFKEHKISEGGIPWIFLLEAFLLLPNILVNFRVIYVHLLNMFSLFEKIRKKRVKKKQYQTASKRSKRLVRIMTSLAMRVLGR